MTRQEILYKIGEILCDEASLDTPEELTMETDFRKDLQLDSLEMINLVTIFDEEFDITVDDSRLTSINTAKDAVDIIEELLGEAE
ncbi:MAG: hypothetical protein KBA55_11960 [Ruminococcus sp.]|nr:hypothetical protein [Ruminococcus sp.]